MKPTLRDLYTHVHNEDRNPVELTTRQRERRERVLTLAQSLMARFGTPLLTFSAVAAALHNTTRTLRFHFADLDALLSALLFRHLDTLLAAVSDIPNDHPNRDQARRAAYLAATRTPTGTLTEAHTLLVRDRHFLPEDILTPLEDYRHQIGTLLAGDHAHLIFPILDNPMATLQEIEFLAGNLRAIPAPRQAPRPQIAPPPPPPAEDDLAPMDPFIRPPSVFDALFPEALQRPAQTRARPPATPPP